MALTFISQTPANENGDYTMTWKDDDTGQEITFDCNLFDTMENNEVVSSEEIDKIINTPDIEGHK